MSAVLSLDYRPFSDGETFVLPGECLCGCRRTDVPRGLTYARGHAGRQTGPDYAIDPETGCWNWLRNMHHQGYGQVRISGRLWRAHRAVYVQARGDVPEGLVLDHLCRNRACVNPDHLEPVTHVENCRRGANQRISDEDVEAIRAATGRHADIAELFGVSKASVTAIKSNRMRAAA
jgi:hypothetical protein